jgi:hypothetical protein
LKRLSKAWTHRKNLPGMEAGTGYWLRNQTLGRCHESGQGGASRFVAKYATPVL